MSDERVCGVLGVNDGGHTTHCIRAYPCEKHGELPAATRYRKALEEIRGPCMTPRKCAERGPRCFPCIATRALTEEERDDG